MESNHIISQISALRNKANEFLINELVKQGLSDIAPSHGFILYVLFKHDGISMKEITGRIHKKKNTVTVLIDKLATHGFITKSVDHEDRRTTRIFLTPKGRILEKSFNDISEKLLKKAYTGFSKDEKNTLVQLVAKMARNLE